MSEHCLIFNSPQQASDWIENLGPPKPRIGFVPTMGALHAGHLSLVKKAKQQNDIVVASIFVNPLQFNNPDDLDKYPRDLKKDKSLLEKNGCSMIFTGTLEDFFPQLHRGEKIQVEEPGFYAKGLEGEFRPGHFEGVRTIVKRLFETIGHCNAYFGEKDFQQTLVVKQIAREMEFIQIVICPTVREENGLAMSSRNERLTPSQRLLAGKIFSSLVHACTAWKDGVRNARTLNNLLIDELNHPDITIEYAQLRDPDHWTSEPLSGELTNPPQALIAIKIGDIRLIDNTNLESELKLGK